MLKRAFFALLESPTCRAWTRIEYELLCWMLEVLTCHIVKKESTRADFGKCAFACMHTMHNMDILILNLKTYFLHMHMAWCVRNIYIIWLFITYLHICNVCMSCIVYKETALDPFGRPIHSAEVDSSKALAWSSCHPFSPPWFSLQCHGKLMGVFPAMEGTPGASCIYIYI